MGLVYLWDQISLEKLCQKFDTFPDFFQEIIVLRCKMVSNGKIFKNLDEITYKTPHRPFFDHLLDQI